MDNGGLSRVPVICLFSLAIVRGWRSFLFNKRGGAEDADSTDCTPAFSASSAPPRYITKTFEH
jgi:hypothetical protein